MSPYSLSMAVGFYFYPPIRPISRPLKMPFPKQKAFCVGCAPKPLIRFWMPLVKPLTPSRPRIPAVTLLTLASLTQTNELLSHEMRCSDATAIFADGWVSCPAHRQGICSHRRDRKAVILPTRMQGQLTKR